MNTQPVITPNTNLPTDLGIKLAQYRLIEVTGADAEKYLQGQLTCDVEKIDIGTQTLTAHCDPKGKMSALIRLYRQSAEQFFIIIRTELLPEALVQLRKYAIFSKVVFTEVGTPIFGVINASNSTSGEFIAKFNEKVTACTIEGTPTRTLFWGNAVSPLSTFDTAENADSELWDLLDIQNGIPILHALNQFELIPQATNLQMLEQAISFTKGCYIGQETVARAKYRGANKRAMFTFVGELGEGNNDIALPTLASSIEVKLGDHWKTTGLILSRIADNHQLWLQVVMNKETDISSEFRLGSLTLKMHPLPYSLDEQ